MPAKKLLANLPCEQNGHYWVITDPPQFMHNGTCIYCHCPDCGEKKWVKLPERRFHKIYKKSTNHTLTKKDVNIGKI